MSVAKAALNFLGFNIINIVFERDKVYFEGEFNVNIEHLVQYLENDKNIVQIVFIVTIKSSDKFNLQVKAVADFKIENEVAPNIYESYLNINAPAIAYPFLRAFISNLVLQTGMKPIILPPVNFAAKIDAKKETKAIQ